MTRTERLAGIVLRLQSAGPGRRCTAAEIASHFGVSRRTILRDFAALGAMDVPVESMDGAGGGYSLPPEYRLAPLPLSGREAALLLVALSALERHAHMPYGDARATLTEKLCRLLDAAQIREADGLREKLSLHVPDRKAQPAPLLDALLAAARAGRWVAAVYQPEHSDEPRPYTLLPTRLYASAGLWYCVAHAHERNGEERIFRADRFSVVALTDPPPGARPSPAAPYHAPEHPEIVVAFTRRGAERATRESDLGSSVELLPDGTGRLRFRFPPDELAWYARYFFAFGTDADVLAPPELRGALHDLARALAENYAAP